MHVRVCGPNLNDQSKGTFHVHRADCKDLNDYGPGKRYGGDQHGFLEMMVKDASVYKVIEATMSDQIDEAVNDEQSREDVANDYASDFWFAPCCQGLPWRTGLVYERWVADDKLSFAKLKADDKFAVAQHLMNTLDRLELHQHLHVVVHSADEYTS